MRSSTRRAVLAAALLAALASVVAAPGAAAQSPPTNASSLSCESDRDPLPPGLAGELAARYPRQRFTAAVVDDLGCTWTLHPERRLTTASVLKIEVMTGIMLRAQQQGRPLTQSERDRIAPMIAESANPPTTSLWTELGGAPGMEALDGAFGLNDTAHAAPRWGLTTTSALDQARFVRSTWTGAASPLGPAMRAEARHYLTSVVPSQRWGATAGVPEGWVVGQKNGFASSEGLGWRLNTAGWVERPDGSGWAIVVLSDGWPDEATGIRAVHELSGRINVAMREPLGTGPGTALGAGDRLDLFERVGGGGVLQRYGSVSGLVGATSAPGRVTSDVDAVVTPATDAPPEAVARGVDGQAWRWQWTTDGWTISPLGGLCSSGPSASFSGPPRYDIACRGIDGQLWVRAWTAAGGWADWAPAGGVITSDPDVLSPGAGQPGQVVARGTDGAVWQYVPTPSGWHLQSLGGTCTSGPAATFTGGAAASVFCRGVDGQLWWRRWTASTGWGGWQSLGGLLAADPDASSDGDEGSLVVGVRGVDGAAWVYRQTAGGWTLRTV